ncbi:unnamed protein product [Adineta steineri]|uniref:Uncharacterized protein n=1 Tax=Adineta steineri TaxID=433720 RepID=A0A815MDK8_9BILA|nr:unnamed protein product [Adineta steineri]
MFHQTNGEFFYGILLLICILHINVCQQEERIQALEKRIKDLEDRQQTFPEVKYLTYKDRKRILVTGGAGLVYLRIK